MRDTPGAVFDLGAAATAIARPGSITDWVQLLGISPSP